MSPRALRVLGHMALIQASGFLVARPPPPPVPSFLARCASGRYLLLLPPTYIDLVLLRGDPSSSSCSESGGSLPAETHTFSSEAPGRGLVLTRTPLSDLLARTRVSELANGAAHAPSNPPTQSRYQQPAPAAPRGAARRAADGDPRHLGRERRPARPGEGPRHQGRRHRLGDHQLLPDLRQPAAPRRARRRPARPPARLPRRAERVHGVVARSRRSPEAPQLLFAARAGQGLGAAMLSPAALSIIITAFSKGRSAPRRSAPGAPSVAPAPPSASCWAAH